MRPLQCGANSKRHYRGFLLSLHLLRSAATVGGMTMISRVFGYLRDMVIAILFGAGGHTDAFFVAFRIPNFLRRLFAEGAFSQAFVPVFTEYKEQRERAALDELLDRVTGTLTLILALTTAVGVAAAPLLIWLFAPGFVDDPERYDLSVDMLRLTFPYLLFISLTALAGGVLNSFNRFAVPALTPVLLNLSMIGAALWLAPIMAEPIVALAWGVLIAGIAQFLFQLPFLRRLKLLPRPRLGRGHEGVRRIMRLMLPAIFGSSVVQINLLFNTVVASFLAAGSISWLYYADRFVELPLAIFGIATATVILPRLSYHQAYRSERDFRATLDWAVGMTLVIAVPATLGLVVLAGPIFAALIQYREFTAFDTRMASLALMAYGAGLPAFVFIKVFAPGFYARQDTATPVRIGIIAMLANMVFTLLLVLPWIWLALPGPHTALALATTVAAYLNAGLLYRRLHRDGIYRLPPAQVSLTLKILAASLAMTAALFFFTPELAQWSAWPALQRGLWLAGLVILGASIYAAVLFALGVRPRQFVAG